MANVAEKPIYVLFFTPSCKFSNNLLSKLKSKPELLKKFNLVNIDALPEIPDEIDEVRRRDDAADHVKAMHVFTEKNPQPDVVSFRLGPRAGRARAATRIRLADTQTVVAIAELSDGSFWSARADVVVTLAACLEDA